jgi:membrane protease YdiL (CAAX protease family)
MWGKREAEKQDLYYVIAFLGLIVLAEVALTLESPAAGTSVHMLTLFGLIIVASILSSRRELSRLLVSLTLIPLIRLFSISTPYWPFADTLVWLAVITFPMLVAAFATIHVQNLKRSDYGLVLGPLKLLPVQVGIMLLGIPLGFLEYAILAPEPWVADFALGTVILGVLVIMFGTGVSEELVFRGILLHNSSALMSWPASILFTTVIFTAMHIGFFSIADLVFVFFVGLFFAFSAYRTGTLLGVIGCHTLLNIMLFMVAPLVL